MSDQATERLSPGDRVQSEYGTGTVTAHTRRSLTYQLDTGELLNMVTGTPGYYRVRPATTP